MSTQIKNLFLKIFPVCLIFGLLTQITPVFAVSTIGQNISTGGNLTVDGGFTLSGTTAGSLLFSGAGGLISQDNANLFWNNTNNWLGIGTNTPQYELDVFHTDNEHGQIRANKGTFGEPNNNDNDLIIGFDMIGGEVGMDWKKNDDLIVGVNATQTAYKFGGYHNDKGVSVNLVTGNVGIRTTTPNSYFQVVTDDGSSLLEVGGAAGARIVKLGDISENSWGTKLTVDGEAGVSYFQNGNVGIGKTNPQSSLDILGNLRVGGDGHEDAAFSVKGIVGKNIVANFRDKDGENVFKTEGSISGNSLFVRFGDMDEVGNGTSFTIDYANERFLFNTGNVGIGTANPLSLLHIKGSDIITRFEITNNSRGGVYIGNGAMFSGDEAGLYDMGSDFPLAVFDAADDTAHYGNIIIDNEKVGIGTTTPGEKLEVNGGIKYNTATAKPVCDATTRGTTWFTRSAAGVKDAFEVCAKDAANAYAWRILY